MWPSAGTCTVFGTPLVGTSCGCDDRHLDQVEGLDQGPRPYRPSTRRRRRPPRAGGSAGPASPATAGTIPTSSLYAGTRTDTGKVKRAGGDGLEVGEGHPPHVPRELQRGQPDEHQEARVDQDEVDQDRPGGHRHQGRDRVAQAVDALADHEADHDDTAGACAAACDRRRAGTQVDQREAGPGLPAGRPAVGRHVTQRRDTTGAEPGQSGRGVRGHAMFGRAEHPAQAGHGLGRPDVAEGPRHHHPQGGGLVRGTRWPSEVGDSVRYAEPAQAPGQPGPAPRSGRHGAGPRAARARPAAAPARPQISIATARTRGDSSPMALNSEAWAHWPELGHGRCDDRRAARAAGRPACAAEGVVDRESPRWPRAAALTRRTSSSGPGAAAPGRSGRPGGRPAPAGGRRGPGVPGRASGSPPGCARGVPCRTSSSHTCACASPRTLDSKATTEGSTARQVRRSSRLRHGNGGGRLVRLAGDHPDQLGSQRPGDGEPAGLDALPDHPAGDDGQGHQQDAQRYRDECEREGEGAAHAPARAIRAVTRLSSSRGLNGLAT